MISKVKVPDDMIGGMVHETNKNGKLKVVEYHGCFYVTVKFIETGTSKVTMADKIRSGNVKDEMVPVVYGVGFIGVGEYNTKHQGYKAWSSMLMRCYSEKCQENNPTYVGCTVATTWHNFQTFADWFDNNYKEYGEKRSQLDKDLLVLGNKVYSPDNCVFIPSWLNNLTIDCGSARGATMMGVCHRKVTGLYQAQCRIDGEQKYIGCFKTEEQAHEAWKEFKLNHALSLKTEIDLIDERIYPNIVKIINIHTN